MESTLWFIVFHRTWCLNPKNLCEIVNDVPSLRALYEQSEIFAEHTVPQVWERVHHNSWNTYKDIAPRNINNNNTHNKNQRNKTCWIEVEKEDIYGLQTIITTFSIVQTHMRCRVDANHFHLNSTHNVNLFNINSWKLFEIWSHI